MIICLFFLCFLYNIYYNVINQQTGVVMTEKYEFRSTYQASQHTFCLISKPNIDRYMLLINKYESNQKTANAVMTLNSRQMAQLKDFLVNPIKKIFNRKLVSTKNVLTVERSANDDLVNMKFSKTTIDSLDASTVIEQKIEWFFTKADFEAFCEFIIHAKS